jgi:hypothetical protein
MTGDYSNEPGFAYTTDWLLPCLDSKGNLGQFALQGALQSIANQYAVDTVESINNTLANSEPLFNASLAHAAQLFLDKNLVGFGDQFYDHVVVNGGSGTWREPVVTYVIQ